MASLSGEKTLAELSAEFGVHPTMISNWKQELVTRAGELFARGNKAAAVEDAQRVIDDLHRKIGQLQVERDFLAGQPAISRLLYLAPDITHAILDGRQPRDLTAEKLLEHSRLPLTWHDRRTALGFA
jgi:transposase